MLALGLTPRYLRYSLGTPYRVLPLGFIVLCLRVGEEAKFRNIKGLGIQVRLQGWE